ncbi:hypothetical protein EDB19DRAFT_1904355 [Suillus lakei]|nr:hypothetical protein EDB19DRAFT_1904355 [Suillus lakei]
MLCDPPSSQIIANCTLACVLIEIQFGKDKFQNAFWVPYGGLDGDSTGVGRRAWNLLDVIGRVLGLGLSHPPSAEPGGVQEDLFTGEVIQTKWPAHIGSASGPPSMPTNPECNAEFD